MKDINLYCDLFIIYYINHPISLNIGSENLLLTL